MSERGVEMAGKIRMLPVAMKAAIAKEVSDSVNELQSRRAYNQIHKDAPLPTPAPANDWLLHNLGLQMLAEQQYDLLKSDAILLREEIISRFPDDIRSREMKDPVQYLYASAKEDKGPAAREWN